MQIPGERPPAGWPSSGVIDVRNLVVRYRPDLDPVIHGISFATRAREKVGVVGRTGCGKSTLMLTLFRIVEPTQGERRRCSERLCCSCVEVPSLATSPALHPARTVFVCCCYPMPPHIALSTPLTMLMSCPYGLPGALASLSAFSFVSLAGEILVDGINTSSLGLFDLRSRLALVPQDPVIFSGTVRSNLDPFGAGELRRGCARNAAPCRAGRLLTCNFTISHPMQTSVGRSAPFAAVPEDASIWEALSRVHMATVVKGLGGLDSKVAEGGGNLSVGQRQLLCMARALLRNSRVLLLDEATSNVDNATDAVIQRTIREAFRGCTVLTIAHRLNTIVDYDRILVLDHGRIAEFDSPRVLLARPGSAFGALVAETGGVGEGQGDDD